MTPRALIVLALAACAPSGEGDPADRVDARPRLDATVGPDAPPQPRVALFGYGHAGTATFLTRLAEDGVDLTPLHDTTATATPLDAATLDAYDVIVLQRPRRSYGTDEADALAAWVGRGGGIIAMSGYAPGDTEAAPLNTLLVALGLELDPVNIDGPVTEFVAHPVTDGLTSLEYRGGHPVRTIPDVVGGVNTVLARIGDDNAAVAQTRGSGRVVLWGDEWVSYDAEWDTPGVMTFWRQALAWVQHLDE